MPISREHDLAIMADKLLEGVEKLFLYCRFVVEKADVIDKKHIDITEPLSKTRKAAFSKGLCEKVCE